MPPTTRDTQRAELHKTIWLSLAVIVGVLGTSIVYSWIKTKPPRPA